MVPRPFIIVLAACSLAIAASACAQTTAGAPAVVIPPLPKPMADPKLPRVRAALEDAELGRFDAARYSDLAQHPLFPWIEFASLRRDIDNLPAPQAQAFLTRQRGQAVAEAFREAWIAAAARRQDWSSVLAAWNPQIKSANLRCSELNARQVLGRADAQWTRDAQALWRTGKSLPDSCDAPMAALAAQGGLGPELRWERIDLAAAEWETGVMRAAARGLPPDQLALANDYAAFMESPHDRALTWPKTPRSREIASQGLAKLGKSSPASAEAMLPRFANALGLDEAQRGLVLYQIALWTVASYEPDSARRLNAVPASAFDDRLHEWRVREAMSRSDWNAALTAIQKMGAKQRGDSRWMFFEGRLSELTGRKADAERLFREAANKPDFHGFLAADRLGLPYALCPWLPQSGAAAQQAIARDPAIVRAMGLFQIDRVGWAVREWDDALSRFNDEQRRIAVEVAQANGWFDRAVFSLGKNPDESRLYGLRFPLHHESTIRREAANNRLDPAWIAAEIRAESIFYPRARSGANAMGLMQILPGTGQGVAAKLGLPWGGADSLYDPDTNIVLGTAYLRQLMDKYGGQPYQVIAGYNAGPAPLARWQSQRPGMDPEFWIETISYKETRDYVARVLAFSVLYDWRLNGDALTLSDRLRGRTDGARKRFVCPTPAAAAPTAPAPAAPAQSRPRSQR
ncbi:lytic transglycosylase domain-containing protein [Lysobacter sp. MMG2]|uniref:lytic transglycosylase domain-containing protein n=1 Tax=Lysobacter sp. MMG2 TaxID=2801338 RepID=UPI001C242A45|nr:lytic transglycosylase domain-containing protein [Lysobacter sp. MMG2]MBU8977433.1 lytic transglycosylase domain-containing protein [Lysobacter sp. MMG2]